MQPLLVNDPGPITARLMADADRPYRLTVLTNVSPESLAVHALVSDPGAPSGRAEDLVLAWPRSVFSVSHVSLPFPPDDPLYGYEGTPVANHVQLGRIQVHGENGVLNVPTWALTRQRSNPFHAYMLQRIDAFLAGTDAP